MKLFENFDFWSTLFPKNMPRFFLALFIILVSLTMTIFSEKVLISIRCICGLMSYLIKKSWTDSNEHAFVLFRFWCWSRITALLNKCNCNLQSLSFSIAPHCPFSSNLSHEQILTSKTYRTTKWPRKQKNVALEKFLV